MARELTYNQTVERSIIKTYRKSIWNPFVEACKNYRLVNEGDRIAVCISGGKDSVLLAKCLQQLKRVSDTQFELMFICMDPGYNEMNRKMIEENCKNLEIPVRIFESDIFSVTEHVGGSPCYLCARMRRGHLYARAKELGCNKIALGHHLSDVIETTVMGMFYGAQLQAMLPKLHSTNFEGMELIRPLYCVNEDAVIKWRDFNNLEFLQCACRFVDEYSHSENGIGESKRQEIKHLIKELRKINPDIESNIFNSIHNVKLDTFVSYKQKGIEHSFLEEFEY
ncbi:MAG: tRNA 2-thiocytidine biosynthesis protein TtcA [Eubacterium sp.]|jgi:tRNA 2-thiocytidine biosynthesis protein TtcA|nr:tRNA 2-thiocytidine biosynthesis protein TtcA [Eubacterium sp.]